jgi:hypothetical protein
MVRADATLVEKVGQKRHKHHAAAHSQQAGQETGAQAQQGQFEKQQIRHAAADR